MEQLFYRVPQVAALYGLSKSKVSDLVVDGHIKSVWIDGCRLIPAEEVRAFAERLLAAGVLVFPTHHPQTAEQEAD